MLTENASKIQQKYLGAKGLIVLIAVMNMFVPLSIDLYLPALPTIGTEFAATPLMVNLTLVSFFFFFTDIPSLYDTFLAYCFCEPIRSQQNDDIYNRLEQSDGSRLAVHCLFYTDSICIGTDYLRYSHYLVISKEQRRIQSNRHHLGQGQNQHGYNNRFNAWQGNVNQTLKFSSSIKISRFI